jgi:hypothetical protein
METCVVLISVKCYRARKTCEEIENQKFDSRVGVVETINQKLNDNISLYDKITILRLSDFMDEYNNQFINAHDYFMSYIHINLDLPN